LISYILKRIPIAIFTVISVSFVAFITMQAPAGDYVDYLFSFCNPEAAGRGMMHAGLAQAGVAMTDCTSAEEIQLVREVLGYHHPMLIQYWNWITPIIFRFDFGISARPGVGVWGPASEYILEALPPTIYLTLLTILITWTLAIPIGIYSAVRQHSVGDYIFTFLGFTGLAVPDFLLALVVMYLLFAYFEMSVGDLHSGAYETAPWSVGKVIDMIQHLLVPAAVLGTAGTAALIRILRNNLLDELSKPYVVTAQAKGMSIWKVVFKYPLKVAINPFISSIGFIIPALISGSVILSVAMGLPTLGLSLLNAIQDENIFLAADITLILGFITVVGMFISDILLVMIDPRIKLSG